MKSFQKEAMENHQESVTYHRHRLCVNDLLVRTETPPLCHITQNTMTDTHFNMDSQHIPFSLEISCSFSCCSCKYLSLWSLNVLLNSSPCFRWSSSRSACCFFSSSCWLCKYQVGHRNSSVLAYPPNIVFGNLFNKSRWIRSFHKRKLIIQGMHTADPFKHKMISVMSSLLF